MTWPLSQSKLEPRRSFGTGAANGAADRHGQANPEQHGNGLPAQVEPSYPNLSLAAGAAALHWVPILGGSIGPPGRANRTLGTGTGWGCGTRNMEDS